MSNSKRIPVLLALALAVVAPSGFPQALRMPSWMSPFPGTSEQTRESRVSIESTYTAAAKPHEVLDHYRRLFAAAGLAFRPVAMGYGFTIRGAADECDLTVSIRNQGESSAVRITCTPITPQRSRGEQVEQAAAETHRQGIQGMEKYDQPVYPKPKSAIPIPAWPAWLISAEGGRLAIQKGTMGEAGYLKAAYTSAQDRATLQSFYTDLLNANGYEARPSGLFPSVAWVEGTSYPDGRPGRRITIRVELRPAANATAVSLRVMEFR